MYRNLRNCVEDLAKHGHLHRIAEPVDPRLAAAEIHRRVFASGGPAILYENVVGCQFPMVSNLFGTMERTRFIFRHSLDKLKRLIDLKVDPSRAWKTPWLSASAALSGYRMLPRHVRSGAVLECQTRIRDLPQLVSWPNDGGPFVTLPMVYSERADRPGWSHSNLGMYRVQLAGNEYQIDRQVGLHYQIHRGIGVHHKTAIDANKPFRVNVFVGGAPAMMVASVMPLPEGMSELTFAGVLAGHRIPMVKGHGLPIYADADFCISGTVDDAQLLPEGPFGDHLGYYSLQHPFPVLNVDMVRHRKGAIWPFTVVGRPPQEDTMFGQLIHEITGPVIPSVVPGVLAVHAVDAAGVHPLMLAIGSERYVPYKPVVRPHEILTQANAILGQGQMSLAKYLLIVANDETVPRITDEAAFISSLLRRVDWTRDAHFYTNTTIDTLDYSGTGLNEGSKVVMAAAGPNRRELTCDTSQVRLPEGFGQPIACFPGVLAVGAPPADVNATTSLKSFCEAFDRFAAINQFPLVVLVDDSPFTAASVENFLWVTFTRSNPAADIDGIDSFVDCKHWGCHGSLVIDARIKPHHAPPVTVDAETVGQVDAMAARDPALAKWL